MTKSLAPYPGAHLGLDIRFVVTSLAMGSAEHIYDTLYVQGARLGT
jgi:hypothetical protein